MQNTYIRTHLHTYEDINVSAKHKLTHTKRKLNEEFGVRRK